MSKSNTHSTITVKQFSKIVQFMFEKRGYSTLENDDSVITLQAPDTSKFGGHLIHFPLDICFCDGIKFLIAPLKNTKVKVKSIEKYINKTLNIIFN